MKILITGGTGLIGKHLTQLFKDKGYNVAILSRNPKEENQFKWDITKGYIDEEALLNTDYIIHLAGAGIADKRWSSARKKVLIDSRVESANLLFKKVKELKIPLKGFISASGIGYYGSKTSENIFIEENKPSNDFIAEICIQWEAAAHLFEKLNIPVTIFRTGIVLAKKDSALQRMNTPLFLAALGNGKQYMPWIHIEDLCSLYIEAVENESFSGIFNAVAPEHHTNKSFTKTLGSVIKKPILPVNAPAFVMKLLFGEMATILLQGSRISSKKTTQYYNFTFSNLKEALKNIFNQKTNVN